MNTGSPFGAGIVDTLIGFPADPDQAAKLMIKWPNLYYSTSAFAPKYYQRTIIDYANSRGSDRIIYKRYFPMGLSLERIMTELPAVPFKDDVWPSFFGKTPCGCWAWEMARDRGRTRGRGRERREAHMIDGYGRSRAARGRRLDDRG
jgi:hypothetical protein